MGAERQIIFKDTRKLVLPVRDITMLDGGDVEWGSLIGTLTDQADLVAYIAAQLAASVVWGNIDGVLTDQADLVAYIAARIAAVIDSSPATLDTLNELAAALGDDPNFSTTIVNLIATKAPDLLVPVAVAGAAYTIQVADRYVAKWLQAANTVLTIPLNATLAVPIGSRVRFIDQPGIAGFVKEDPAIVFISRDNAVTSKGAGAVFEAHKLAVNTWSLIGDLA